MGELIQTLSILILAVIVVWQNMRIETLEDKVLDKKGDEK